MALSRTTLSALLVFLFATCALAQRLPQSAGGTAPPPDTGAPETTAPQPQAPAPVPEAPTIVSNVNLVNLVVSVQTSKGGFVPGLTKDNFRVSEDNRPQNIRYFSAENQVPLTLGWLIDTSPSQVNVLRAEQAVSDQFFDQVLGQKDLAFVLSFDVNTTLLQDLTSSRRLLKEAIDGAHIGGGAPGGVFGNPGPFPTPAKSGATHLWDAIVLACHDRLSNQVGRKAIVVVTDGVDEGSQNTDRDALRALLDSNTVLYTVVASDPGFYGFGGFGMNGGSASIRHLADASGGRSFDARPKDMSKAFKQIAEELRSQYTLAYQSDRPQLDGTYRKIKVQLVNTPENGLKVRTRGGYYAEKPST